MSHSTDSQLTAIAADLAFSGGQVAMRYFSRLDQLIFEEKADEFNAASNLVSEGDRAVQDLIRHQLERSRPGDGFLGEENGGTTESRTGLTWVVDPIDGTLNFAYGRPDWAVSVAVVDGDGTALAGAVYVPVLKDLYMASRGGGATLNGRPLRLAGPTDLAHTLLELGHGRRLSHFLPALVERFTPTRGLRRCGSAALSLCYVAAGKSDAAYWAELKHWDYAAGLLIAEEAGALSTQLVVEDEPVLLVAAPGIHSQFVAAVRECFGLEGLVKP